MNYGVVIFVIITTATTITTTAFGLFNDAVSGSDHGVKVKG
jgi:hypothetical protein